MARKRIWLFALIALELVFLSVSVNIGKAGDNTWTTTGPYGVRILGLSLDPDDSQIVYAATPDGTTKVYKSIDGGITWTPSSDGIPEGTWAVEFAFDSVDSDTIYLATEGGVYKSSDAGTTWELKSTMEISDTEYVISARSIASSPVDRTLYVGAYGLGWDMQGKGGIYRSKDGGETWQYVADESTTTYIINTIEVAPSAPHTIYAGGDSGIFKSIDGGDTWQRIDASFGVSPDLSTIAVDPYDAQVVYIGVGHSGIYKTTNGGQTWTPIGSGLDTSEISDVAIDAGNQQVLYVAGGDLTVGAGTPGVYRSRDNSGLSWTSMMDGMGSRGVYSLAIDQNDPQNIYAGTRSGVWKYTLVSGPEDYNMTVNNGALFTNQTAVTLTLTAPSGTDEMMISNDGGFGGASWEPFKAQKLWTITAYGDYVIPRTVYAKFKTKGQISGLYQDDIVLDVNPPTGTVEISGTVTSLVNNGYPNFTAISSTLTNTVHLPIVAKNYRAGYTQVDLLLSSDDDLSGVGEMLISNDSDFADAQWEIYATEKTWWAIDAEEATVYVKYRDRAGNESPVYSDLVKP